MYRSGSSSSRKRTLFAGFGFWELAQGMPYLTCSDVYSLTTSSSSRNVGCSYLHSSPITAPAPVSDLIKDYNSPVTLNLVIQNKHVAANSAAKMTGTFSPLITAYTGKQCTANSAPSNSQLSLCAIARITRPWSQITVWQNHV